VSSEIQKWADQAMFRSESMVEAKPKVYLLDMTQDPLGEIAACAKMYKGEVVTNRSQVTDEERLSYFADGHKTVLGAPFEAVNFHFLFEGVTRAFTHQLVRQRTATYFQESMRFAVVEDSFATRVGLPPSLDKTLPDKEFEEAMLSMGVDPETNSSREQRWRNRWDAAMRVVEEAYVQNVNDGQPAEDARGMMPTNILTRVHYITNYRNLMQHAGNRLCTQAQFEWRYVFNEIVNAIKNARVYLPGAGEAGGFSMDVYMREQLAQGFAPVCYQTGKCGFKASFDRACTIRSRVDANAAVGRPSSKWHLPLETISGVQEGCGPINPAEWALDDAAARS
jgi:flavin-dependent thymidylate synthase